jgi:UDP-N-acetylmuramoyl-tripeptide--D-alanyl-D-alanine ligase
MNFPDPFQGYSVLLRVIVYGVVPLFLLWQFFRLRRALHVFQLEGYKRKRFLQWCASNGARALFLSRQSAKKPLVMTGRAWRILVIATLLSGAAIWGPWLAAHLVSGWPADLVVWAVTTALVFLGAPLLLVSADVLLHPVQSAINARYMRRARKRLDQWSPTVIGVTGSFGKTSTKTAIASLVGEPGSAFATPGSYNTPMGVTRSINENLTESNRYFVVEMGAYKEGDIAELCSFVRPRIGVLTAIGPAHLERFGSLDAIRRGKYEIVTSLPHDGVAIMNVDDPEVRALADRTTNVRVVRYGIDSEAAPDLTARDVRTGPDGTRFRLSERSSGQEVEVATRLLGKHAIGHVLAGAAVATVAGRPLAGLVDPIARLEPPEHRLQLIKGTGGVTVIDDAYNSNPSGAAAALEVLQTMPARRKVVVTPGMVELGPLQAEENERFGAAAAAVADVLIVVAPLNRKALVAGASRNSDGAEVIVVDSLDAASERLKGLLAAGDVVLFENDLPDQYEN